ncbi:fumarylacetoacetate hydrolase family protein [Alteromonas sp. 14N.309.X.WAT.G.H12]|uniref:fumarylacetoacetate hydrolase family protein n=1 Tax=Alteromonas sp. 14N.309.X.WAT.G.H12 TaxID=3120824 RepID=UPI002FD340D4
MRFIVGSNKEENADSAQSVYAVYGEKAVNISQLDPSIGSDLTGLMGRENLKSYIDALTDNAPQIAVDSITPALPVASPSKVICLGLNYADHIKEGGYKVPTYPALFMRSVSSLMPAGAPMVRPACSDKLDYEAELMVIIGKGGKHIAEDEALSHVFAYTLFNDGSVRDYQRKTHQWTPGKNFDSTGAIGPVSVTPDELPEGAVGLKIESRVGDEILQSATTSDMLWSVARVISEISVYSTLEEGDFIAMGTPPGVGHAKTPPRWLKPGEVVEVEIESIGICASPIVDEER